MADEERQNQPEGQEPEAVEPEGQEPEAQDPATAGERAERDASAGEHDAPAGELAERDTPTPEPDAPGEEQVTEGGDDVPAEDSGNGEEVPAEGGPAEGGPAGPEGGPAEPEPAAEAERPAPPQPARQEGQDDVIPGAHLEPDLVLEEERQAGEEGEYADTYAEAEGDEEPAGEPEEGEQPVAREPLDLAADARYAATGKRKTAVARVILKPGDGSYTINGRHLDQFFPRVRLQRMAQQPLETAGYNGRMDVVARIHGGGVSAQAGALRHGIARALVEADPNLRLELKRRGFLTRDPREKERKKAGLKKARKRPQFSKR